MLDLIRSLLKILSYWFNPEQRRRAQKEKLLSDLSNLEHEYAAALADGDPQKAAEIDDEMRKLREKIILLEGRP